MNPFALSGLLNGILGTFCGILVYFQNPKNWKNKISGCYFVSITVWSYFYFFWQISRNPQDALFFCRALMMGAIFLPVFQYHMTLSMYGLESPGRMAFLKGFYGLTFLFAASNFTPTFVEKVEPRLSFAYWPVPGWVFHFYLFSFFLSVILSLLLILEYRKTASPLIRNKILWFALGITAGYGGGGTNFFLWYNIPIPPYLNFGAGIFIGLTALSFFKLGLLDIRLFLRETTVHLLTSILIGGTCSVLTYPFHREWSVSLIIMAVAFVVPSAYRALYSWLRGIMKRTNWGRFDRYLGLLDSNIGKIRESSFTYDDLAENLVQAVLNTFPVELAAVYFLNNDSKEFQLRAQKGMSNPKAMDLRMNRSFLSISMGNPLILSMTATKRTVNREELELTIEETSSANLLSPLLAMEAEVAAPFLFGEAVKGFLVLGKKKDGELFHKEDLKAVESYRQMGADIMRYITGLETEVRHAALYSHDMNNDTKALVQMLQFVQSPLGKKANPDRIKTMMSQAEEVAVRLNQSFQLNRDRSALILKSIKGEYFLKQENLVDLMRESAGKCTLRSQQEDISFIVRVPGEPLMVSCNAADFVRVIDNLLSNAFRYISEKGIVTLEAVDKGDHLLISVSNTGEGIDLSSIEHIWDFGWQVKDSKQGASGMGLSLVKQIINLHKWSISVSHLEGGEGTKFTMAIPLTKNNSGGNI